MQIWQTLIKKVSLEGVEISAGVVKLKWQIETSDRNKLKKLWTSFNRPAFKTPAEWEVSVSALVIALADTITGLGGGVLPIRDFATLEQIDKVSVPKITDFNSSEIRDLLFFVMQLLETLYYWLKKKIEKVSTYRDSGNPKHPIYEDNGFRIGLSPNLVRDLDRRRKEILDILNPLFKQAGCEPIVLKYD